MSNNSLAKFIIKGIFALMILVVLFSIFGTIDSGTVGVKTRFGKVVQVISPGFYVKKPFIENVTEFDVQQQKEQANASAASSDLQTVDTTIAVNYNIDPQKAGDLFIRIGSDYRNKIIDPAIQESIKSVTAKYTAEELITKRQQVTDETKMALQDKLAINDINVTNVNIVNFSFSEQFNAAIEKKVTAEQNALAAKNKLEQINYEAQQTVVAAKAQAEAIQIQAQAIQQQGGANYVQLQSVKVQQTAVEKWDGKGCTTQCWSSSPNTPVPFLNISK